MGFEPTTFSLARRRSTTELHPHKINFSITLKHRGLYTNPNVLANISCPKAKIGPASRRIIIRHLPVLYAYFMSLSLTLYGQVDELGVSYKYPLTVDSANCMCSRWGKNML